MGAKKTAGGCGHLYTVFVAGGSSPTLAFSVFWCGYCGALGVGHKGRREWTLPAPAPALMRAPAPAPALAKTKGASRKKRPSPTVPEEASREAPGKKKRRTRAGARASAASLARGVAERLK